MIYLNGGHNSLPFRGGDAPEAGSVIPESIEETRPYHGPFSDGSRQRSVNPFGNLVENTSGENSQLQKDTARREPVSESTRVSPIKPGLFAERDKFAGQIASSPEGNTQPPESQVTQLPAASKEPVGLTAATVPVQFGADRSASSCQPEPIRQAPQSVVLHEPEGVRPLTTLAPTSESENSSGADVAQSNGKPSLFAEGLEASRQAAVSAETRRSREPAVPVVAPTRIDLPAGVSPSAPDPALTFSPAPLEAFSPPAVPAVEPMAPTPAVAPPVQSMAPAPILAPPVQSMAPAPTVSPSAQALSEAQTIRPRASASAVAPLPVASEASPIIAPVAYNPASTQHPAKVLNQKKARSFEPIPTTVTSPSLAATPKPTPSVDPLASLLGSPLTFESPKLSLDENLPGLDRRFIARGIDLVLMSPVLFLTGFAVRSGFGASLIPTTAISVVVCLLFLAIYEAVTLAGRGRTFGKHLLGLRVIRESDASPVSGSGAVVRSLMGLISSLLLGVGNLFALADQRRRTLQDRIAGTMVIDAAIADSSSGLVGDGDFSEHSEDSVTRQPNAAYAEATEGLPTRLLCEH